MSTFIKKIGNVLFDENTNRVEVINYTELLFDKTDKPSIEPKTQPINNIEDIFKALKGLYVLEAENILSNLYFATSYKGVFDCIRVKNNQIIEAFSMQYFFESSQNYIGLYLLCPDSERFREFYLGENLSDFYISEDNTEIIAIDLGNIVGKFNLVD